jgi:hypothetical protein
MRLCPERVCDGVMVDRPRSVAGVVYSIRFGAAVRENRALFEKSGECGMEKRVAAWLLCVRAYGNDPAG